jgi:hypothetical protein
VDSSISILSEFLSTADESDILLKDKDLFPIVLVDS